MRNEYTDYIAHGHKYFAVVDLGKKNSKGSKLRRYFYSANEYKAYLQGKKTTDDKLLGAASKVANKLSGVKAIGKGLTSTAKAINNTNKKVKSYKEQGMTEEEARNEIKKESTYSTLKRAGLKPSGYKITMKDDSGKEHNVVEAKNSRGKRFYVSEGSRHAVYEGENLNLASATKAAKKAANSAGKRGVGDLDVSISEERGDINKERHEKNKAALKANPEKSILNNPIRENFMERMIEKGVNKANAESIRKKLEETYERATKIGESANNLKGRLDKLQEAFTSGDGDKALDAIDETLKDQEAIQKDILTIVDEMLPEAKNVADTFLDMGKKTLDTATAGPKAIVGDKHVKTFEDSSTTWDDVKISDNPDNMKKIQDAVDKAFKEKNKNRKK